MPKHCDDAVAVCPVYELSEAQRTWLGGYARWHKKRGPGAGETLTPEEMAALLAWRRERLGNAAPPAGSRADRAEREPLRDWMRAMCPVGVRFNTGLARALWRMWHHDPELHRATAIRFREDGATRWLINLGDAPAIVDAGDDEYKAKKAAKEAYEAVLTLIYALRGGVLEHSAHLRERCGPSILDSVVVTSFRMVLNDRIEAAARACEAAALANGRQPPLGLEVERDRISVALQLLDREQGDSAHVRAWLRRRWTQAVRCRDPWAEEVVDMINRRSATQSSPSELAIEIVEWVTGIPEGTLRARAVRRRV